MVIYCGYRFTSVTKAVTINQWLIMLYDLTTIDHQNLFNVTTIDYY